MSKQKITHEQLREELENGLSKAEIARKYSMSERVVHIRVKKLKASGYDPENERRHKNPEDQPVSGYSTLVRLQPKDYEGTGRLLEWVKTNRSIADQLTSARAVIEAMASDLPKLRPIPERSAIYDKKKFTVIPIGDPHIGLLTWSKEVGEDWDLSIAKRVFTKVLQRLLARCPDTEEAVLVNTGDFFHSDNINNTTSRSGHSLDVDGRHGKWLDTGVVILRMMIDMCLMKYKRVTFVNVPGNHDDILGSALGVFACHMYEQNERINVLRGDSPFQYVHRGNCLIGFAHGHTAKLKSLPGKMADDEYILWGKTTHRHWFTGHVHHNQWQQYKEHPGCTVESVGIIPPKDAYAYGGAYGAKRTTQAIVFDYDYGEFERYHEIVRPTD
jgi:biotin operon repressor